jgi:hypothetical protein
MAFRFGKLQLEYGICVRCSFELSPPPLLPVLPILAEAATYASAGAFLQRSKWVPSCLVGEAFQCNLAKSRFYPLAQIASTSIHWTGSRVRNALIPPTDHPETDEKADRSHESAAKT